jgi:octopine/nopaline transport system ATP-binding protein
MKHNPIMPFDNNLATARKKFQQAAHRADAALTEWHHPLPGPGGEPIGTCLAVLEGTDPTRTLMIVSGIHGIEGIFGSACQVDFLSHVPATGALPCRVALVHAANPYGFASRRRVDEDNVDPNRNFIDFTRPLPSNRGYAELHDLLLPEAWPGSGMIGRSPAFLQAVTRLGVPAVQAAITSGQYTHPTGLFFGGLRPSHNRLTIESILAKLSPGTLTAWIIDLHTGIGRHGEMQTIVTDPMLLDSTELDNWPVPANLEGTLESGSATLVGTFIDFAARRFQEAGARRVVPIATEIGTLPPLEVLDALVCDNWLHTNGDPDPARRAEADRAMLAAFAPQDPTWQMRAIEQGRSVIAASLAKLAQAG